MMLPGSCHCGAVHFSVESHTPYLHMPCYYSICRKTAGGGGYAINIMGQAASLKVQGKKNVKVYQAKVSDPKHSKKRKLSPARRNFCGVCGSALWIEDPRWPEWIYPFTSAIDTPLPIPPERVHIMLDFASNWCEIPKGKHDKHYRHYPDESIVNWHRRHALYGAQKRRKR